MKADSSFYERRYEMSFCSNCGAKLNDGTKFCFECGLSTSSVKTGSQNQRKAVYDGELNKCPNCGETLGSFITNCTSCGYELRGKNATYSIKEFELKFEKTNSINSKIDLIKNFAIPNTKEDVREFLVLASANIDTDAYNSSKEISNEIAISNAWLAKYEQAYQKSKIILKDSPDFDEISAIYNKKKKSITSSKRCGKLSRFFRKNKDWILPFAVIIVIMLSIISRSIPHTIKEFKLERLVDEVELSIAAEDFDTARVKVNQIKDDSNWSTESEEKWDSIRESLLGIIKEKEALSKGIIYIGLTDEDMIGLNYEQIVGQLESKGFTNVKAVSDEDLLFGWLHSDGEVKKVTIAGDTNFLKESSYLVDTEIIVTYYTFSD